MDADGEPPGLLVVPFCRLLAFAEGALWLVRRMLLVSEPLQGRIAVVLVRARNPLNIGAAARAMSNFGFTDLRVVNDYDVPFQEARSAVDAAPVLAAARRFASVAEAVADCSLVFGTTALGERRLLHSVDLLRDVPARVQPAVQAGSRVAPPVRI